MDVFLSSFLNGFLLQAVSHLYLSLSVFFLLPASSVLFFIPHVRICVCAIVVYFFLSLVEIINLLAKR